MRLHWPKSYVSSTFRKETDRVTRLCAILIGLAIAAAFVLPAFGADRSEPVVAPPGTYWNEELGVFVFDPPIPIVMPPTLSFPGEDLISFDGDTMYYTTGQMPQYFVLTKMPRPECQGRNWVLTSVLLACYNVRGQDPDAGRIVVYDHLYGEYCLSVSPWGDSLGDLLGSEDFKGLPYVDDSIPKALWTKVDFTTPVNITRPEFWVAWDYMTGWDPWVSYYVVGNWRKSPPPEPEDYDRFFEWFGSPCPSQMPLPFPWAIRAIGHCVAAPDGKIDIKPQSCPNPLNVKSNGVLPVAILGTDAFDVADVDPTTILLEGVPPLRWAFEDVATPFPGELCDCWTEGPDGWEDLTVKFKSKEIVAALGDVGDRDTLKLTMTWTLYDGTEMSGSDCVIILHKPAPTPRFQDIQTAGVRSATAQEFALYQNTPNPVKSHAVIMFSLAEGAHTTLTVYDASGSTVAVLVDGEMAAGVHAVEWNASVPAGTYFYRLNSGECTATRKLIRLP